MIEHTDASPAKRPQDCWCAHCLGRAPELYQREQERRSAAQKTWNLAPDPWFGAIPSAEAKGA